MYPEFRTEEASPNLAWLSMGKQNSAMWLEFQMKSLGTTGRGRFYYMTLAATLDAEYPLIMKVCLFLCSYVKFYALVAT